MAILEEDLVEVSGGVEKQVDAGAINMMMDILQKHQYSYPIKSTIRELVSNSVDSVKERKIAMEILSGKAKVSDYYSEKEGDLYKDSKFDADYYKPEHFLEKDDVEIVYYVGDNVEKDRIEITDWGVGLGGYRLEKYFSLGYSTKRLSKIPIGKFGLGNKSPLSINPYYTIESRYNGYRFKFNVYSNKIESIIPKLDLKTGENNKEFQFSEASGNYKYYGERTQEGNGLTIIIQAKKHHQNQYTEAVESQLLYFEGVRYFIEEDGDREELDIKAKILYEDEHIVVADNYYYSKPHVLLNRVNYGYINFDELEMETLYGNVGIKLSPDEISISPSRENLIWNETTKAKVTERFQDVVSVVTNLVQEELKTDDFWQWIQLCCQLSTNYGNHNNDTLVGRLSGIVETTSLKPKFGETNIRFEPSLFEDSVEIRHVQFDKKRKGSKQITKIKRAKITDSISQYHHLPVYFQQEKRALNRKDKFLLHTEHSDGFLLIRSLQTDMSTDEGIMDVALALTQNKRLLAQNEEEVVFTDKDVIKEFDRLKAKYEKSTDRLKLLQTLLQTSDTIEDYQSIVVPDSFTGTDDEEEAVEVDENTDGAFLSNEERRKLSGKTLVHTPRLESKGNYNWKHSVHTVYQKVEIPVSSIDEWDEEDIYYGSDADRDLITLASIIGALNHSDPYQARKNSDYHIKNSYGIGIYDASKCPHFFDNPALKLIKVAKDNVKYYRDFNHIKKFFQTFKNGKLTMAKTLINWNTARYMSKTIYRLGFLQNIHFVPKRKAQFDKFFKFVSSNYSELYKNRTITDEEEESKDTLIAHLDKVQEFQEQVARGQYSEEEIGKIAIKTWATDKVIDAQSVHLDMLDEYQELLEWAEPMMELFNRIPYLTGNANYSTSSNLEEMKDRFDLYLEEAKYIIPEELEKSLKFFMKQKGVKF